MKIYGSQKDFLVEMQSMYKVKTLDVRSPGAPHRGAPHAMIWDGPAKAFESRNLSFVDECSVCSKAG